MKDKKKKKKHKRKELQGTITHSSFPKALDYNWDLPIWPFYIC
jgi:hypothetical protein